MGALYPYAVRCVRRDQRGEVRRGCDRRVLLHGTDLEAEQAIQEHNRECGQDGWIELELIPVRRRGRPRRLPMDLVPFQVRFPHVYADGALYELRDRAAIVGICELDRGSLVSLVTGRSLVRGRKGSRRAANPPRPTYGSRRGRLSSKAFRHFISSERSDREALEQRDRLVEVFHTLRRSWKGLWPRLAFEGALDKELERAPSGEERLVIPGEYEVLFPCGWRKRPSLKRVRPSNLADAIATGWSWNAGRTIRDRFARIRREQREEAPMWRAIADRLGVCAGSPGSRQQLIRLSPQ